MKEKAKKSKEAQNLANLRWGKTSKKKRKAFGAMLAAARARKRAEKLSTAPA